MQIKSFTDQLLRTIEINYPPKRIISLVPSQTELLFDLGLNEEILGITKFCIHPKDKFKSITKVGGTKKLNIEKIKALKPDLIIGNKEENQKEDIEALMQEFPVWMSDIYNLEDALEMIKWVGELVNKQEKANEFVKNIKNDFHLLSLDLNDQPKKKAVYFIWKDPNMVAGDGTFIHDMLKYCGLENLIKDLRYPSFNDAQLQAMNPEVVLLSSEPYPFKEKHIAAFKKMWPKAKVELVDGEMFSWYGSMLLKAPPYFKKISEELNSK